MKKKLWLSASLLSSLAIVTLPIASVVSCGSTDATSLASQNQAIVDNNVNALKAITQSSLADGTALADKTSPKDLGIVDTLDSEAVTTTYAVTDTSATSATVTVTFTIGTGTDAKTGTAVMTITTFNYTATSTDLLNAAVTKYSSIGKADTSKKVSSVTLTGDVPIGDVITELSWENFNATAGTDITVTKVEITDKSTTLSEITVTVTLTSAASPAPSPATATKTVYIRGYAAES